MNRTRRSLMDCGDYRIFDTEDHVEVLIYGDDDRLALAQQVSADIPALIALGERYGRLWFRFPGRFIAEGIEIHSAKSKDGIDFVLTCSFDPAPESDEQDFDYTQMEFGFIYPNRLSSDRVPRCVRFTVAVC